MKQEQTDRNIIENKNKMADLFFFIEVKFFGAKKLPANDSERDTLTSFQRMYLMKQRDVTTRGDVAPELCCLFRRQNVSNVYWWMS